MLKIKAELTVFYEKTNACSSLHLPAVAIVNKKQILYETHNLCQSCEELGVNILIPSESVSNCPRRALEYFFRQIIIIIIIKLNIFIDCSLISAQAVSCLRALFSAMRIHSYRRMASLIRMRLNDLYATRSRHIWRGNL